MRSRVFISIACIAYAKMPWETHSRAKTILYNLCVRVGVGVCLQSKRMGNKYEIWHKMKTDAKSNHDDENWEEMTFQAFFIRFVFVTCHLVNVRVSTYYERTNERTNECKKESWTRGLQRATSEVEAHPDGMPSYCIYCMRMGRDVVI